MREVAGNGTGRARPSTDAAPAAVSPATRGPRPEDEGRAVRVFVSSTFLDMQRERDILVRQTFPALRARFRARGVELLEVDLRWGITQEQAESGATLSICLSEIDRCRPNFIGLIGERYGWAPPLDLFTAQLSASFPAIAQAVGASVTEMEVVHGVLSDPEAARRAIFFMRDPAWVDTLDADERAAFVSDTEGARERQEQLKARIGGCGARVVPYRTPDDIGAAVEEALGAALQARFPEAEAPDAFTRAQSLHAAYARERRGLHVGAEPYLAALDRWGGTPGAPPLVITGASGGGKSTLIANWLARHRRARPADIVLEHYLGASPDSADPALLVRRLWEHLNRATGETVALPPADASLVDAATGLAQRLALADQHAGRNGTSIVVALDGLDKLASEQNLRWLPRTLGPRIRLLASSLPGEALQAAEARRWSRLAVEPLSEGARLLLVERMLEGWGRKLARERVARILAHPLAGVPLFLKTVLEELRYSAISERLDARIDFYLGARDMPELFARLLERLEDDSGADVTARLLTPIWASRAGLEEASIVAVAGTAPLAWAQVRNGLGDSLRDQLGRIAFAHDFLRQAVVARYAPEPAAQRARHLELADHFAAGPRDARQAEELPYQLRSAEAWQRLEETLLDLDALPLLRARGDVELLGHWLPLAERGRDPEALITAAFAARAGDPAGWTRADLDLASAVGEYLEADGARGRPLQALGERRTEAYARVLGPDHPGTLTSANNLAQTLLARGDLRGAERLFSRVLETRTRILGPDHPDTLSALNNLAQAAGELGDLARAQDLQQQAFDAGTRIQGADHPSTLTSRNNLAHILAERGDNAGAGALLEAAYEASTRVLGPEHVDTLSCAHNLADTYKARGDLATAQEWQERILETRLRLLGPVHPNTLTSLNNLATTLMERGDMAGARALQERVLEATARLAGAEHPDTLTAINNLAQTIDDMGDREAAQALFRRAVDGMTRALGPEHPDTLTATNNLAQSLKDSGDIKGALALQQGLLATRRRVSGPDHPTTLAVMSNHAQTRLEAGDPGGALELARSAMEASARALGPEHPQTLTAAHNHAGALLACGDTAGALETLARVVEVRTRLLGPDHPATLTALGEQAQALQAGGDPLRARTLSERVLETRRRLLGDKHPDTLAAMSNLAAAMRAAGDPDGARALLQRAHDAMRSGLGLEHPTTLSMLTNFASTLKACGDWEGAQSMEVGTLEARMRISGPDHPETLTAMNNLAQTLYARGGHADAQKLFEQVLAGRERTQGPAHMHTLTALINLAQTRKAQGDIDGARALEERALEALGRVAGPDHPLTLTSLSNLVGTLRLRGDLDGARALEQRAVDARARVLGPDHPDTLTSMNALGEIAYALGDLEGARALFEPLVERRTRVLGADHPDTLLSTMSLAAIVWSQGDLARAGRLFVDAHAASAARLGADHALTRHGAGALADLTKVAG
jgi:tetratricopeptide (TPR) repeat protein